MSETYSVVIPAHNAEKTLDACLASVVAQTLLPLQVMLVDDHSVDGTGAAVRRWESRFADAGVGLEYLRLAHNAGPSAARNQGMRHARGSCIAFLDADDIWASDKLEVVDRVVGGSHALVCHDYTEAPAFPADINSPAHAIGVLSIWAILLRNPAQSSCVVMCRESGFEFDETMRYCEDHDLWLRIAERYPVIRLVGRPLTRLGRPQLSAGGLSGDTVRMRSGQLRVYYNFCKRNWRRRAWLLPALLLFSLLKHIASPLRRSFR